MKCPFCQHDETQVLETRDSDDHEAIRRRRRCSNCDKRFTTFERIELPMPLVIKRDGSRTEFDSKKLHASLMLALRKRPVFAQAVDGALRNIREKLMTGGEREVSSQWVGNLVMDELKSLDKIAYIRFASVYKNFADINEFQNVIHELDR